MKRLRRYLPLLALLLMLAGSIMSCRDAGVRDALQRAEALMETDPHAARAVLDSLDLQSSSPIPHSSFLIPNYSRRDFADWAWLKVQADYKCYIPLTTDALARIATDYYGTLHRPDYHAAMAWYTLGCCYTDLKRTEEAFSAYLKARRLFPATANRYYALCEQNIGKCYLDRNMKDEAIRAFQRCRKSSVNIGDSTEIAWSDFFLGRCYLYKEEYDRADSLFEQANENPYATTAIRKRVLFERSKISHYRDGDYDDALRLLRSFVRQMNNTVYLGAAWTQMGNVYSSLQRPDSAAYYYNMAIKQENDIYTSNTLNYRLLSLKLQEIDNDSLLVLFDTFVSLRDSLRTINNRTEIIPLKERFEYEQKEHRIRQLFFTVLSIVVILFFSLLVCLLARANRRKKSYIQVLDELKHAQMKEAGRETELERVKREARQLRSRYEEACQRVDELENQPQAVEAALSDADSYSAEREIELSDYERRIHISTDQFRHDVSWRLVQKFRHGAEHCLTKNEREAVRHDMNVCFADFYDILQHEGLRMSQTEKMVAVCYLLGFKAEESEELLGISDNYVRVTKSRLKKKLSPDFYHLIFPC
ncbi:MAG: tetratricopeptide repeat protein, partial [Bacteroidaceae bacterium]|nr:tetratricopeptide repeat protein [Bacteroidaceae bacterium]